MSAFEAHPPASRRRSWSPLQKACAMFDSSPNLAQYRLEAIKDIIEETGSVNQPSPTRTSPLHLACLNANSALAELLIDEGADVNAKNKSLETPLHFAAHCGNVTTIDLLLCEGADVDARDEYGATPLHWAMEEPDTALDVVELLLDAGAYVDERDGDGCTPLHRGAECGAAAAVKALVAAGADVTEINDRGFTPLMCAMSMGHLDVANVLPVHIPSTKVWREENAEEAQASDVVMTEDSSGAGVERRQSSGLKGRLTSTLALIARKVSNRLPRAAHSF